MKYAVINCHHENMQWLESCLPGAAPYLLPIVNKPLLEYFLDFCSMCAMERVLILDSEYDAEVAEFVGDGSKWDLALEYRGANTAADGGGELLRQRGFFPDSDAPVLVFNGLFFAHYDQREHSRPEAWPDAENSDTAACGFRRWSSGGLRALKTDITPIDGIMSYYRLNMQVLRHECPCFCVPGYNSDAGVYTGMNDVIPPGCKLSAPLAIGDNVRFGNDCVISGSSIGSNVIADTRSEIVDSVILNNTYIGSDLEFSGKVVYHNHVTDPETGTVVNLLDAQLAGELRFHGNSPRLNRCLTKLGALPLLLVMLLPYWILRLAGVRAEKRRFFLFSRSARSGEIAMVKVEYTAFPELSRSSRGRLFRALSLDKVPLLNLALQGKLGLTGDFLYDADAPDTENILRNSYHDYRAGVFSLSDFSNAPGDAEKRINDLYLEHNRSLRLEIYIIARTLLTRLFGGYGDK